MSPKQVKVDKFYPQVPCEPNALAQLDEGMLNPVALESPLPLMRAPLNPPIDFQPTPTHPISATHPAAL